MADTPELKRRGFFGAVAAGAAGTALAATPSVASAAPVTQAKPSVGMPSAAVLAADSQPLAAVKEMQLVARSGSDYMVDVLHSLPFDYIATMPGSSFRGIHESIVNYGGNKKPEMLTTLHEEVAVGMAHGYAKVAGKPMATLLHGVVGLQHGSMAIYNAWADRVPVVVFVGNTLALEERRPGVEWAHSALDNAAIVRDFVKWDDMPMTLDHFGESTVRAYRIATTPPFAPTLVIVDGALAEGAIPDEPREVPKLSMLTAPVGDPNAVMAAAKMLVGATNPVILVDKLVKTADGLKMMIELAETLQAPVVDKNGRMNFPSRHYLNHSDNGPALVKQADVIIGLEMFDLFGAVNAYHDHIERSSNPLMKPSAKLISIGAGDLLIHANFQDFQRYQPADLAISGDGEATLPLLLDAVKRSMPASTDAFTARGAKLREAAAASHKRTLQAAAFGWEAQPISVARLVATLGQEIKDEDWALTTPTGFQSNWQFKLWNFDKHYQHIGDDGGGGVGYTPPASVGAALAHRDISGGKRLVVSFLGDGNLMCTPTALWTAAHHKIPLLAIVHNNRAYHQEVMHVQRMADRHGRGIENADIGTTIKNPDIDYAKMADSMGVWSKGPITDPADLGPAIKQAIAMVKQGQPALIDVVSQPR
jgi:thiamine pyrophosphate-dependent acetolactate synthase large subunit-like protein